MRSDDIATCLLEWDGKHTDTLKSVHAEFSDEEDYTGSLAMLCGSENVRIGEAATWLVLHGCKSGLRFAPAETTKIVQSLDAERPWGHALQLCQAMKYLDISKGEAQRLLPALQSLACHKRPFVRAWAVDAAVVLGKRHGGKPEKTSVRMLAKASEDPAASVRARVRNIAYP